MRRNGKGRIDNTDIRFIRSLMRVTASDRLKSEERVETNNKLKNITTQAM
jgi:hypothetical protein